MALFDDNLTAQDLTNLQAAVTGLGAVTLGKINEVYDWLSANMTAKQERNKRLDAAGQVFYESILRFAVALERDVPNAAYTDTIRQLAWDQYNFLSNHITINEPPFAEPSA